ncbi:cobalamin biosynthesis protein [Pseudofrankia sp. BMG5.37]|uniref:cobalamin biosynthesis protein n=1 Tax=Pseudofrankia sp. BMG5.37 TaxID=3050035 RepID=UPI002893E3BF|nr:cobalamin biosynthesis protein [Pseudofrankia sp. BMG5.37]MDT3446247.1 cobalamin biosynthesis protein [Pseudofrankia sp. BMG5.37]
MPRADRRANRLTGGLARGERGARSTRGERGIQDTRGSHGSHGSWGRTGLAAGGAARARGGEAQGGEAQGGEAKGGLGAPGPAAVAAALVAGALADAVLADPARFHPVAGYGRAAHAAERLLYADSRPAGVAFVAAAVGGPVLAAAALDRRLPRPARPVALAVALWAALGGTSLRAEAVVMSRLLTAGDLVGGRERLGHLCGRDPSGLDEPELARAAIESVAENTADAVLGPLLWGALLGLPGVVGYRAANTLDAMVGHRSERYLRFGWAAARLDDVANLVPARLCAVLTALTAPVVGGSPREAWRVWRRDGYSHPSPNAGQCEAAFAGALGITLGGTNVYEGELETRGRLGDGSPPRGADVARSGDLAVAVAAAGVAVSALVGAALTGACRRTGTRRRPGPPRRSVR